MRMNKLNFVISARRLHKSVSRRNPIRGAAFIFFLGLSASSALAQTCSMTGSWSGTFVGSDGSAGSVTAMFTQNGISVVGTATITTSTTSASGNVTGANRLNGASFGPITLGNLTVFANGSFSADCGTLTGNFHADTPTGQVVGTYSIKTNIKSRFTLQQKASYAQSAQSWMQRSAFWQQQVLDCQSAIGPPGDPLQSNCNLDKFLVVLTSAIGLYYNSLAGDPADPNFTTIAQPTPPVLPLPSPDPSWTAAELTFYQAWKTEALQMEQLVGVQQATITSVNRAGGALAAGNTFWEQQQVAAISRYAGDVGFQSQVLLVDQTEFEATWVAGGFALHTITADHAAQFSADVAASGLPADLQQQLTALGFDAGDLALLTTTWSSSPANTTIGDIAHAFDALVIPIQQLGNAFTVQFASFRSKVRIEDDEFEIDSSFILGPGNDGIEPSSEDVSFSLGPLAITIPAGNFRPSGAGFYHYAGTNQGIHLRVRITPGHKIRVHGAGARLDRAMSNPIPTVLRIGDDSGMALAQIRDFIEDP